MRIISFDGRLGKDAQILTAKNGRRYIRFSVANNIFTSNEERTDWFDVTCYDDFIIDKRGKFLTKGTYVIVTGTVTTDMKPDAYGRSWINHHVTASNVEIPRLGKTSTDEPQQAEESPAVSVYTASTASQRTYAEPTSQAAPQEPVMTMPADRFYTPSNLEGDENGDLPF